MRRTALRSTLLGGMLALTSCSAPSASRPEAQAESERDESGPSVHVASWLELRERSWALDRWGLTRGDSLSIADEVLADGRLRIEISAMHLVTGTTAIVELQKRGDGTLAAQATVKYLSDEGSDRTWTKPTGTILVSTDDWSKLHDEASTPLMIEVRLHDVPMTDDSCFHAVVELPR
jgi:hypothetical protein